LDRHAAALPPDRFWLEGRDIHTSTGLFRTVDFYMPEALVDQVPPPETLSLMQGRFALRLGRDGKPFEHDVMDGDARSSAPFFEQMFPYLVDVDVLATGRPAGPTSPLQAFQGPEALLMEKGKAGNQTTPHDEPIVFDSDEAVGMVMYEVHTQFEKFARFLSVTVASYAMRDHTANQMRILTALTAMTRHPEVDGNTSFAHRRIVAAARGEMDSDAAILAALDTEALALAGGVRLRVETLPKKVMNSWLTRVQAEYPPSEEVLAEFGERIFRESQGILRPNAKRISGMDAAAIDEWVERSMEAGATRNEVSLRIKLRAFQQLLDSLGPAERDRVETWILLDHVQEELYQRMIRLGADRITPEEITEMGQTAWQVALEEHGHNSQPVPQGRRAVDPTAICTTKPGLEAMNEPAFGIAHLDLLVLVDEADDGRLASRESVLEAARDQSPFFLVDDPLNGAPVIARLVDVPGSKALYRVRWTIWTGWHVLWGLQELGPGKERLVPWTTAVCEDMVLAPSHLVPTLLRGGLLDGRLFPTEPVRMTDVRQEQKEEARLARQARRGSAAEREKKADANADKAAKGAEGIRNRVGALQEGGIGALMGGTDTRSAEGAMQRTNDFDDGVIQAGSEAGRYLQELTRGGLVHDPRAEEGVLVYAFHIDRADKDYGFQVRPRTPYATRELGDDGRSILRASAWSMVLVPEETPGVGTNPPIRHTPVSPAHRATDTLMVEEQARPSWKRAHPIDWTLSASLGGFPYRQVNASCNVPSEDLDVLSPCPSSDLPVIHRSNGLSSDVSAMMTMWWLDSPRVAVEWGLETHLDVVVPGTTWLFPYDDTESRLDTVSYGFSYRPAAGFIGGLRHAPRPMPLYQKRNGTTLWGIQGGDLTPRLMRTQWGIRSGILFGPGYSGLEATALAEWWWGWALRRRQGQRAHLTPYHPALLVGPYVRGQFAGPVPGFEMLDDGQPRALSLDSSVTVLMGARIHVRVNQKASPPVIP
jgi:hypothetical protein